MRTQQQISPDVARVAFPRLTQPTAQDLQCQLILLEAIMNVGWIEHANDWDWACTITLKDHSVLYCNDELTLTNPPNEKDGLNHDWATTTHLNVVKDGENEDIPVSVLITDIQEFQIHRR